MKILFAFLFLILYINVNAIAIDTTDNWQLRLNGKPVVFGPLNTGANSVTIKEGDQLSITYNHCSPEIGLHKTISVTDKNGTVFFVFTNDPSKKEDEVKMEIKKFLDHLRSKNKKSERFTFMYAEKHISGKASKQSALFTVEIKMN